MQTEKREPHRSFKEEMLVFVLTVVKDLKRTVKSWDFAELCFSSRFQIAQEKMLPMTGSVDLIVLIVWIFAQN